MLTAFAFSLLINRVRHNYFFSNEGYQKRIARNWKINAVESFNSFKESADSLTVSVSQIWILVNSCIYECYKLWTMVVILGWWLGQLPCSWLITLINTATHLYHIYHMMCVSHRIMYTSNAALPHTCKVKVSPWLVGTRFPTASITYMTFK